MPNSNKYLLTKRLNNARRKLSDLTKLYETDSSDLTLDRMDAARSKIEEFTDALSKIPKVMPTVKSPYQRSPLVPVVSRTVILSDDRWIESVYPDALRVKELKVILNAVVEIYNDNEIKVLHALSKITRRAYYNGNKSYVNKTNYFIPDLSCVEYEIKASTYTTVKFKMPDRITLEELGLFVDWVGENHAFFMEGMD